ncbi:MAG: hypothetical protein ABIZ80_23230, partial [Bryobacteraceae bacterium]
MKPVPCLLFLWCAAALAHDCVPAGSLRSADSLESTLSEANCRLSDGTPFAEYSLTLPVQGELQLLVTSEGFPVSAIVRDASGRKVAQGASIRSRMERGEYSVLVNSATPGGSGRFKLTSAFQPEPGTLCRAITPLGPHQSIRGQLGPSSCHLLNGAYSDSFLLTTPGSGTVEIALEASAFEGRVTLRDDTGRALDSDPRKIVVPVFGDTGYTVVVAAAVGSDGGAYTMSVSFTPADDESCRPQKILTDSGDTRGTINDSSCSSGAGLRYHYYTLRVSEGGLADLRVSAPELAATLTMLDASGRVLAFDAESGGPRQPVLRQQLERGEYTVLVTSPLRGGDYTLQYRFRAGLPEICPALTLENGAVSAGSLAGASSCRLRDAMQDQYRFTASAPGTVEITLVSSDFNGILTLRDAKDNALVESRGADFEETRVTRFLPAGAYSLSVAGFKPGRYTVAYRFTPSDGPPCPTAPSIALNGGYIGILGNGCFGVDGKRVDYYQFTLSSEGTVGMFMTSSEVDSDLSLLDAQGAALRHDDNSYGGYDSMIVQHLTAGTYRLAARSATGDERGRYRIDVLHSKGPRGGCRALSSVSAGQTLEASLYITSCQYTDDTFGDIYKLEIADARDVE